MSKKQITLYSDELGPNGWKVAMVLNELGIPYETVLVDVFSSGSGMSKGEFTETINPNGRIPAIVDHLDDGDFVLWESVAIIGYLVSRYDAAHTYSFTGPRETAEMNQWLLYQASGQGPYFGQASWFVYYHPEKNLTSVIQRYRDEVRRVNGVLDGVLRKNGGWLVGGKCSVADLAFVIWTDVVVNWKPVMGDDFDLAKEAPAVHRWFNQMMALPGVDSVRRQREAAKMRFKA
ncbi:protein of unknown function [Taphrina deformans PYCC 5710]|uniref:Glutathione S-transferase n=1 Tax=Taphrina deformans (strain PYCC 5710 / ATCC 11124 / CBS 356.35 / IMI 108563 / JCM 9778 / NBRC 8474) TaxID=1097556 RepID=R4XET9_TAPDE|nr:protein of unknown function [Taphrina deformans PYCC 5710]|eukprot:CCG84377.1 protein of unknown function [Taphrina deformans PYCC 5710]